MSAKAERDFQDVTNKYAHNSISILKEMVEALEHAQECDGTDSNGDVCKVGADDSYDFALWHDEDGARTLIDEDPLSVEVRCSNWRIPGGEEQNRPNEYCIVLGTGGPASRIIGELDNYGQPKTAEYQYQDWFKPWTQAETTIEEDDVMLRYAQNFYFGE